MFEFLSFGAGVNSTAVLLLSRPRFLIFADTGDEYPETYEYLDKYVKPFVASYGGRFVTVRNDGRYPRLRDHALAEKIIPVRVNRWCTDKWKIRPIQAYLRTHSLLPCVQMIAIDAGESHRAKPSNRRDISNCFPLITRGIDRDACQDIIRAQGWPVPPKSGCFYCPFQSKHRWIALKRHHPELFQIALKIERNGERYGELFLAARRPLEEFLQTGRIRETDCEDDPALPCACYDG
jgi:hypothetical protein